MKFKQYLQLISLHGSFPTPHLRWIIRTNSSPTAREEAIAASMIEQANPRENITGHFPWGPEQQFVLQQLWICGSTPEWRDVPIEGAEELYSDVDGLPVPITVKEPGQVIGDFRERLREILGEDYNG